HRLGGRDEVPDQREALQRVDVERVQDPERDKADGNPSLAVGCGDQPARPLGEGAHAPSGVRSPRRPSGRNTRVRMRMPNTIERVPRPPGAYPGRPSLKGWMKPIRSAPRTAPGRLPIPPRTAAVKAMRPSSKPVS